MWPDIRSVNIYIKAGKTDMRKQINSLAALVEQALGQRHFHYRPPSSMSGSMFATCAK
jgi:hypothetical protein